MPLLTPPREKSKHIEAKPDFLELLLNCTLETRQLFSKFKYSLVCRCECQDYGYTNKPDFRIANQYVMIELEPREGPSPLVKVFVRVDHDPTLLNEYRKIASHTNLKTPATVTEERPGIEWLTFDVTNEIEAAQAVDLLAAAYISRTASPF